MLRRCAVLSLQSFAFFGFLLVVAAVYLHLPRAAQSPFLLGASALFYGYALRGTPLLLAALPCVCLFTWLCGLGLERHRTACLWLGTLGSIGILAFFKYNGAFAGLAGWRSVAMPLGLSFFTFAALGYLFDAAAGDCPVEKNLLHYALFLSLFATVTQGPICRAGALLPQFREEHRFDEARTVRALRLLALGLFKLVAVSDVLGVLVDEVFAPGAAYGGPMHILALLFYTLQLYFNFCGYSEVARAVGLLLGLELPENFKTPFFATNFSGFWSRWHISLSSWLQDHLFTPLAWVDTGRWFGGHLPAGLCIFVVFFVSGLWHGDTWPFVVWGVLQAAYRLGEEALHRMLGKPKKRAPARVLWAKRGVVFALWCVSMAFFKIGTMPGGTLAEAGRYLLACGQGFGPARFAAELYAAIYNGFYAHPLMVAGYYAFAAGVLALAFYLDWQRAFAHKNRPAEECLAADKHRTAIYYLLVTGLLLGYIMQSGGFGGAAGFGMYAGF